MPLSTSAADVNNCRGGSSQAQLKSSATAKPACRSGSTLATVVPVSDTGVEVFPPQQAFDGPTPNTETKKAPPSVFATALALEERVEFVKIATSTLFLTEFIGLVEFTEILMPVIYTAYLMGTSQLPNRQFYPRLAALDHAELNEMIRNVLTYTALELVSFVVIMSVIRSRFKFSPVYQVVFVLEKQMFGAQSKLVLWTFYVVQCMLFHSGVDFSMKFEWLKNS